MIVVLSGSAGFLCFDPFCSSLFCSSQFNLVVSMKRDTVFRRTEKGRRMPFAIIDCCRQFLAVWGPSCACSWLFGVHLGVIWGNLESILEPSWVPFPSAPSEPPPVVFPMASLCVLSGFLALSLFPLPLLHFPVVFLGNYRFSVISPLA